MIQRRAARFVFNDYRRTSSVTEMMEKLGWQTLQQRRDYARLTMMYRIVHQLVDIPTEPYLTPLTGKTRGNDSRFRQIQTSYTGYQYSFFPRMIILRNQSLSQPYASQCWKPARDSWPPPPTKRQTILLTFYLLNRCIPFAMQRPSVMSGSVLRKNKS